MWAVLSPEVHASERAHAAHAEALVVEAERWQGLYRREKASGEATRLQAALTGVCEDLEDTRKWKQQQHSTMTLEIARLRGEVDRLSAELAHSQQAHARDVASLRAQKTDVEVSATSACERLEAELDTERSARAKEVYELSDALRLLKGQKDRAEEAMHSELEQLDLRRRAEVGQLNARVQHMRELQKQALALSSGKGRQVLFMADLQATGKPESPYTRGDVPSTAMPAGAAAVAGEGLDTTLWSSDASAPTSSPSRVLVSRGRGGAGSAEARVGSAPAAGSGAGRGAGAGRPSGNATERATGRVTPS